MRKMRDIMSPAPICMAPGESVFAAAKAMKQHGIGKVIPDAIGHAKVLAGNRSRRLPIYARDTIGAGLKLPGPLIVVELSATTYVAPEFTLRCDDHGNLHLETR